MVTVVVLLSLGVFILTDFVKFVLPFTLLPPAKMLMAWAFSASGAITYGLLEISWTEGILVFLGTSGLSSLVHVAHKFISAAGDEKRAMTLNSRARR